jgi:cytoskeletal protein CcmA (bactofilin family)
MAMFDLGKRGAGAGQGEKVEEAKALSDADLPGQKFVAPASVGTSRSRDAAVIGPSIHVEGTLRGEEDLIIEGRVSGTINLQGHSLTVGTHGQINANIYAHTVTVDGTVEGDLFGAERVVIRKSANIRGNVTSPRVSLEEGARFKGTIEMDAQAVEEAMGPRKAKSSSSPAQAPVSAGTDKPDTGEKSSSVGKASGTG